jgi:hypothetical protein
VSGTDPMFGCGSAACTPCEISHATPNCAGAACIVASCDLGWADCNAAAVDGCETDLSKSTSCGGCSAVCPPATPFCTPSGNTFVCTNGCALGAPLLCGKDCVDPVTSTTNCGGCNHKCPDVANATTTCAAGVCGFSCKAGFHACGGKCASTTDPKACGAACDVCTVPPHAQASCAADVCAFACDAGWANCDANAVNGCETHLSSDAANCGACGVDCMGGACNAGVCGPPPDAGH